MNEQTERIATLTMNPAIDRSFTVERIAPNRKLRCGDVRHEPGGGGLNASRAIRKLGGESVAVYIAGGHTGALLHDLLAAEGIDHRAARARAWTRENVIAVERTSGDQYRFGMPGGELNDAEWRACLDALFELDPPPDYIVASGSLPPGVPDDLFAQIAGRAEERGIRVIADTSGEALRRVIDRGVHVLKPNLREFAELTGLEETEEDRLEPEAQKLIEAGRAEAILLSLGAGGALLVTADGAEHIRAPTVKIQSRIGAGDSTVAGLVLALARGEPMQAAARFAVAAGAAAVMTPGTELCRREDAERLYHGLRGEQGVAR